MEKKLEKHTGLNGSGQQVFHAVTVCQKTGQWLHIETFTNEKECESWIKWA